MLKTVFSALAVTALLAGGAVFAAEPTGSAPAAGAVSQPATPVATSSKSGAAKAAQPAHHTAKHSKTAASSEAPTPTAK
jgi:hypothetical protein